MSATQYSKKIEETVIHSFILKQHLAKLEMENRKYKLDDRLGERRISAGHR